MRSAKDMHPILGLALGALLVAAGCATPYSSKGKLDFAEYQYSSVEGDAWPEADVELDGITKMYELGEGARIHYVELNPEGTKTIVFVHGLGSYLKFWRYQLDVFAEQGYRVLALDLPGYGKSVKPATFPYTMESFAEVVKAFIEAKGLDKPIIVGHSMGGHTALTLAINYPEMVSALVLTAPAGFEKFSAREKEWFRKIFSVGLVKSVAEPGLWGTIKRSNFYRWQDEYEWLIEERARVRLSSDFDAYAYANVRSVQGLTHTEFTRGNLGRIQVPTMIIFGTEDRLIPNRFMHGGYTRDIMSYGAERIAGSKLVELAGCGHTVQMDCWQTYNQRVLNFLSGAPAE